MDQEIRFCTTSSFPPMGTGDRMLAALAQCRSAGREMGRDVRAVEKMALYYLAVAPAVANPRHLRESVVRGVERVPAGDDRMKYDHLFGPGDPENKSFWLESQAVAGDLINRYVGIED